MFWACLIGQMRTLIKTRAQGVKASSCDRLRICKWNELCFIVAKAIIEKLAQSPFHKVTSLTSQKWTGTLKLLCLIIDEGEDKPLFVRIIGACSKIDIAQTQTKHHATLHKTHRTQANRIRLRNGALTIEHILSRKLPSHDACRILTRSTKLQGSQICYF